MLDWILILGCIALIMILAQLSIMFQKRAGQIRLRQQPLRSRIQSHREKIHNSAQTVLKAAEGSLEEIEFSIRSLSGFNDAIDEAVVHLKAEVESQYPEGEEGEEGEEDEGAKRVLVDDKVDPRAVLHEVLQHRDELESHIAMLRSDAENIKRNIQRLQGQMMRGERKDEGE